MTPNLCQTHHVTNLCPNMTPNLCQTHHVTNDEETDQAEQNESLGETHTIIVMPEYEKKGRKGILLIVAGGLIFFISVLLQQTIYVNWWQEAGPVYAIITSVHVIFLGVFQTIDPEERTSFELIINGKQIVSFIPLRAIILSSINLFFSTIGIIFMCVMGVSWSDERPMWNILGLTISILIAVTTLLHLFAGLLSSKYQNFKFPTSMSSLPDSDGLNTKLQTFVTNMADTITGLLPEFPKASLTKTLQVSKSLLRKNVHYTLIDFSMLLASVIFVAQLLDIAMSPRNQYNEAMSDPKCTYALNQLPFLDSVYSSSNTELSLPFVDSAYSSSDTKSWVFISAPVTVFLCMPLFFLTNGPSMLNLILAFIISGAMAVYFCFQTIATISWMILMGSSVTPLTFYLRLGITISSPILASLFLSLAFSYLNTCLQKEKQEDEKTSSTKEPSSVPLTLVALLLFIVSIAAFVSCIYWFNVVVQSFWNSDQSGKDSDCDYIGRQSYQIMTNFLFFSLVQSSLSLTLLTLSLLLILTINRISPSILLFVGIISFASALRNLIFYFTGFFDYASESPIIYSFYFCNGLQMALGLIFGCSFSFEGRSFFVTIFSILSRTIIIILALSALLVISLVVGIIKLANLALNTASKEKEEITKETCKN